MNKFNFTKGEMTMKTMNIKSMILTAAMLITSMLSMAATNTLTLPMQSTSAMQASGSPHDLQVREAYAPDYKYTIIPMRSTSTMMETGFVPTPTIFDDMSDDQPIRPRKGFGRPGEEGQSDEFPIGEPYVLLLFAAACAAVTTLRRYRRRKAALCEQCNISKTE